MLINQFLKSEKVTVLPQSPYFSDLTLQLFPDKPLAQPPAIPRRILEVDSQTETMHFQPEIRIL